MGLGKYRFLPKEKLPAENVNSINPDSVVSQTAGHLDGGVNSSILSEWLSLENGANDGKIKLNSDGVIYNNLPVNLKKYGVEAKNAYGGGSQYGGTLNGESFVNTNEMILTKVTVFSNAAYGALTMNIYAGQNVSSGTPLATISIVGGSTGWVTFVLPTPILLLANTAYSFMIPAATGLYWTDTNNGLSNVSNTYTWAGGWQANRALYFELYGNLRTILLEEALISQTTKNYTEGLSTTAWCGQFFTIAEACILTSFTVSFYNGPTYYAPLNARLYRADINGKPTGAFIENFTRSSVVGSYTNQTFTLTTPYNASIGDKFVIVFWASNYTMTVESNSVSVYAGGNVITSIDSGVTWVDVPTRDLYFIINAKKQSTYYATIAGVLQSAIRNVTGKLETVIYSVNKFIVTSGNMGRFSCILKFMSPTSGTDISGNGATKYFDCGTGATETLGTGEEYNLPRLNGEGVLAVPIKNNLQIGTVYNLALIDAFKYVVLTNASAISVNIPTNAVVAFPIGTEIYLIQGGAGKVTLSGAGVTINSLSSYKSIAGAGGQATLIKIATDTWQLYGNLIA